MCGIVGVISNGGRSVVGDLGNGAHFLQHRGPAYAGLFVIDPAHRSVSLKKGEGLATETCSVADVDGMGADQSIKAEWDHVRARKLLARHTCSLVHRPARRQWRCRQLERKLPGPGGGARHGFPGPRFT